MSIVNPVDLQLTSGYLRVRCIMSLSGTFSPQLWLAPLALRAASRERSEAGLEAAGEKMRRRMSRRRLGWAWLMSGVCVAGQVRRD